MHCTAEYVERRESREQPRKERTCHLETLLVVLLHCAILDGLVEEVDNRKNEPLFVRHRRRELKGL